MSKMIHASITLNVTYEDCTETLTDGDMLSEVENTLNKVIKEKLHPDALVDKQSRLIVLDTKGHVSTILSEDVYIEFPEGDKIGFAD
jgi:hypothetical protein